MPAREPYDVTYPSQGGKTITALVCEPPRISARTGLMLIAHGWGNNRFQYRDDLPNYASRYDVLCAAPEFRDSGFDHDAQKGLGTNLPHDFSHMQVVDCLNALPAMLERFPGIDQQRILGWGASHGGHIILLCAEYAPHTFAFIVDMCGITHATDDRLRKSAQEAMDLAGREIRDGRRWLSRLCCPVLLLHGTEDPVISPQMTDDLYEAMVAAGVQVEMHRLPGLNHSMQPSSRYVETVRWAERGLLHARGLGPHDFALGGRQVFPCSGREYVLEYGSGRAVWQS